MTGTTAGSLAIVVVFGVSAHAVAQTPVDVSASGGTELVMGWKSADWGEPSSRPRLPSGLQTAPVAHDPETGGITYLARFPAGTRFDMHWHTYTETVMITHGAVDIILGDTRHTVTEGSYIIIPGTMPHEWQMHADTEVVVLVRRDGPPDRYFVDP